MDDNSSSYLDKNWLTPDKLEKRSRLTVRQAQIHIVFQPESNPQEEPCEVNNLERPSPSDPKSVSFTETQTQVSGLSTPVPFIISTDESLSAPSSHHSDRSNKGSHQSMRYINTLFLASITGSHLFSAVANYAY